MTDKKQQIQQAILDALKLKELINTLYIDPPSGDYNLRIGRAFMNLQDATRALIGAKEFLP